MNKKKDNNNKTPRVFISYSWEPKGHKDFVKQIADRLINDGIDIVLDRYDLKAGHDKYAFMESMVTDKTIDFVLIMSNEIYASKSNDRKGGVGAESTIISQELYGKVKQEKFIPIVIELDENNEPFMPVFIKSRMHFNFSDFYDYESEYERLLRHLHDEPLEKKPPIGKKPDFYTENPNRSKLPSKLRNVKIALYEGKGNPTFVIEDFLDTFLEEVKKYKIESDSKEELDEQVFNLINESKVMRDYFLEFFEIIVKLKEDEIKTVLHQHIEKWDEIINENRENREENIINEQRRFLLKEIFLYMMTIAFDKQKYELITYLIHTPYWARDNYNNFTNRHFTFIYYYPSIIDKQRLDRLYQNEQRHPKSISTDILVKQERIYKNIDLVKLKDTDLFLYYISNMFGLGHWFPLLSMYGSEILIWMKRAESPEVFYKMLKIFRAKELSELRYQIAQLTDRQKSYYDRNFDIVDVAYALNLVKLEEKFR